MATLPHKRLLSLRNEIQMVFQNPFTSLNPRMRLLDVIGEPLAIHGMKSRRERVERVGELLSMVGLQPQYMWRYPHAFSGGERQRISIARALALRPRLVAADEAVSALDVSVQAQVLTLMRDLQRQFDLTYLFVTHDLGVVRHFCDRVAVMYAGVIVETAPADTLFAAPRHPYTAALLSAAPVPDPAACTTLKVTPGEVPNPADLPPGCRFHPRCPHAVETCRTLMPEMEEISPYHHVSCHRAEELIAEQLVS